MTPEERARIEGEIEGILGCIDEVYMSAKPQLLVVVDELRRRLAEDELEAQRRSFAYGNTTLANDSITRETVDKAAERMHGARVVVTELGDGSELYERVREKLGAKPEKTPPPGGLSATERSSVCALLNRCLEHVWLSSHYEDLDLYADIASMLRRLEGA